MGRQKRRANKRANRKKRMQATSTLDRWDGSWKADKKH